MFKVEDPTKTVDITNSIGFRITHDTFIYLPLDKEARASLSKVGKEIGAATWLTPYGDTIWLEEADYGIYNISLNHEIVGMRVLADDVGKLVSVIENGRALIAVRSFKKMPTRADIATSVRIGLLIKNESDYTMLSMGRIPPSQAMEFKKFGWSIGNRFEVQAPMKKIVLEAYTGLGQCPVLCDGNPVSVPELIAELEEHEVACYALRDLR